MENEMEWMVEGMEDWMEWRAECDLNAVRCLFGAGRRPSRVAIPAPLPCNVEILRRYNPRIKRVARGEALRNGRREGTAHCRIADRDRRGSAAGAFGALGAPRR